MAELKTPNGLIVPESARNFIAGLEGKMNRVQQAIPKNLGSWAAESKFKDFSSYMGALKLPWVNTVVGIISINFANCDWDLMDGEDIVEDENNQFLQLMARPNPHQSYQAFMELASYYIELTGEIYISLEERDGYGRPREIYLLNPARMRVLPDPDSYIKGYIYDTGMTAGTYQMEIPYDADEVIQIKMANPMDDYRGLGNVEACEDLLNTVSAMANHEWAYWDSGGRIIGVLETDDKLTEDEFNNLKTQWMQFSNDKRQRYKTAILEQGLKYSPIAEGMANLDLVNIDKGKRDQILAVWGLPLPKTGIMENAQYKLQDADMTFWSECMEPRLRRWEDGIQQLVDLYDPDLLVRFERKNFEDDTVKLQNATAMHALRCFTADEIRVYLGHEELGAQAGGDIIWVSNTDIPVKISTVETMAQAELGALSPPAAPPGLAPPPNGNGSGPVPLAGHVAGMGQVPLSDHVPGIGQVPLGDHVAGMGAVNLANYVPGLHGQGSDRGEPIELSDYVPGLNQKDAASLMDDLDRKAMAVKSVRKRLKLRAALKARDPRRRLTPEAHTIEAKAVRRVHAMMPATAEVLRRKTTSTVKKLQDTYRPELRNAFRKQQDAVIAALPAIMRTAPPSMTLEDRLSAVQSATADTWAKVSAGSPVGAVVGKLHKEAMQEGYAGAVSLLPKSMQREIETKAYARIAPGQKVEAWDGVGGDEEDEGKDWTQYDLDRHGGNVKLTNEPNPMGGTRARVEHNGEHIGVVYKMREYRSARGGSRIRPSGERTVWAYDYHGPQEPPGSGGILDRRSRHSAMFSNQSQAVAALVARHATRWKSVDDAEQKDWAAYDEERNIGHGDLHAPEHHDELVKHLREDHHLAYEHNKTGNRIGNMIRAVEAHIDAHKRNSPLPEGDLMQAAKKDWTEFDANRAGANRPDLAAHLQAEHGGGRGAGRTLGSMHAWHDAAHANEMRQNYANRPDPAAVKEIVGNRFVVASVRDAFNPSSGLTSQQEFSAWGRQPQHGVDDHGKWSDITTRSADGSNTHPLTAENGGVLVRPSESFSMGEGEDRNRDEAQGERAISSRDSALAKLQAAGYDARPATLSEKQDYEVNVPLIYVAGKRAGKDFTDADEGKDWTAFNEARTRGALRTANIDKALQALAKGQKVELTQPRQVSTLIDKLAVMANNPANKGPNAPKYNLCDVSVSGTNLFCADNKGITRILMPQLKGAPLAGSPASLLPHEMRGGKDTGEVDLAPGFIDHLKSIGIDVKLGEEGASYLRATQNELVGANVAGIQAYLKGGGKIEGSPLLISKDGYIVDGHHRWAAQVGVDLGNDPKVKDLPMKVARANSDILSLLTEAKSYAKAMGIPEAAGKSFEDRVETKMAQMQDDQMAALAHVYLAAEQLDSAEVGDAAADQAALSELVQACAAMPLLTPEKESALDQASLDLIDGLAEGQPESKNWQAYDEARAAYGQRFGKPAPKSRAARAPVAAIVGKQQVADSLHKAIAQMARAQTMKDPAAAARARQKALEHVVDAHAKLIETDSQTRHSLLKFGEKILVAGSLLEATAHTQNLLKVGLGMVPVVATVAPLVARVFGLHI